MSWAEFIFAHGAGAGSDSDFMQTVAEKLTERGVSVRLFDFSLYAKSQRAWQATPAGQNG